MTKNTIEFDRSDAVTKEIPVASVEINRLATFTLSPMASTHSFEICQLACASVSAEGMHGFWNVVQSPHKPLESGECRVTMG